jgi:putative AlgH/UPF0301 family transcriptional regulator
MTRRKITLFQRSGNAGAGVCNSQSPFAAGGQLRSREGKGATDWGRAAVLLVLSLLGAWGNFSWGEQETKDKPLFLVARPSIRDPYFAQSVVLMLPIKGEPLIVGLIINKSTRLPLSELFPDSPAMKNRSEKAYFGGPVDPAVPALVFHSPRPPKATIPLYDDVYVSFDAEFISKLLHDPKQTGDLRLFLGRAQWAPEQLQGEALEGSWYSLRAEGEVIFDRDPEHVWERLHRRAKPPERVENRLPQPSRGPGPAGEANSLAFLWPVSPHRISYRVLRTWGIADLGLAGPRLSPGHGDTGW